MTNSPTVWAHSKLRDLAEIVFVPRSFVGICSLRTLSALFRSNVPRNKTLPGLAATPREALAEIYPASPVQLWGLPVWDAPPGRVSFTEDTVSLDSVCASSRIYDPSVRRLVAGGYAFRHWDDFESRGKSRDGCKVSLL
ncbi:hypothetical protein KM043_004518 [Ampulex compressa]|nr:hypothetical protein KM043_004518 [Ampulex compressa]